MLKLEMLKKNALRPTQSSQKQPLSPIFLVSKIDLEQAPAVHLENLN